MIIRVKNIARVTRNNANNAPAIRNPIIHNNVSSSQETVNPVPNHRKRPPNNNICLKLHVTKLCPNRLCFRPSLECAPECAPEYARPVER